MLKVFEKMVKNRRSKINKICELYYNFIDLFVFVFEFWVFLYNIVCECNLLLGDKVIII